MEQEDEEWHLFPNEGQLYKINLRNIFIALKNVSYHPYLIKRPVLPGSDILIVDERLVSSSGKMVLLDQLLKRLYKSGHKVLYNFYITVVICHNYMCTTRVDQNKSLTFSISHLVNPKTTPKQIPG